jgi:hypothetical protein
MNLYQHRNREHLTEKDRCQSAVYGALRDDSIRPMPDNKEGTKPTGKEV